MGALLEPHLSNPVWQSVNGGAAGTMGMAPLFVVFFVYVFVVCFKLFIALFGWRRC